MTRRSGPILATWLLAAGLAGCVAVPPGPTQPPASAQPASASASIAPAPSTLASAPPSSAFGRLRECPAFRFDAGARLGPAFQTDVFEHGESEDLSAGFIAGLKGLYAWSAKPDACDVFSRRGLQSGLSADALLAAVANGTLRIDGDVIFRAAFEGEYDLRHRPPTVPIDVVYDVHAGATLTNPSTGDVLTTSGPLRFGLNVTFAYDGHSWLVERVGPITAENEHWAQLPKAPPAGPVCADFRRDPPGAAFDDDAGASIGDVTPRRAWCDQGGLGPVIGTELLVFHTRYPCDHGSIADLALGTPFGTPLDPLVPRDYLRDPKGEARRHGWLLGDYLARTVLPADAVATGWTNGNIDLWTSPADGDSAIYVQRGATIERWPRASDGWGVIDCN